MGRFLVDAVIALDDALGAASGDADAISLADADAEAIADGEGAGFAAGSSCASGFLLHASTQTTPRSHPCEVRNCTIAESYQAHVPSVTDRSR
jgi:hypothetical protein